jgi:hypothetical protein
VLTMSAGKAGLSEDALRARAVKEAAAAGPNTPVYIVRHIDTTAFADESSGPSAVRGGVRPLMIYRLRDGKEEPVRGITFANLVPRSLKDLLVAAGKDAVVYNYVGLGVGSPGSVVGSLIAPSVLSRMSRSARTPRNTPSPRSTRTRISQTASEQYLRRIAPGAHSVLRPAMIIE